MPLLVTSEQVLNALKLVKNDYEKQLSNLEIDDLQQDEYLILNCGTSTEIV